MDLNYPPISLAFLIHEKGSACSRPIENRGTGGVLNDTQTKRVTEQDHLNDETQVSPLSLSLF